MPNFYMRETNYQITLKSEQKRIEFVFTRGHCHSLALALHKLTGWPLVGLFDGNAPKGCASHVCVLTPENKVLDIGGADADHRWEYFCNVEKITEARIKEWEDMRELEGHGYTRRNVEGAIPFAKRVLRQYLKTQKKFQYQSTLDF